MQNRTWIIVIIALAIALITWSCRGLIGMALYGQMIKPTETPYFSRGYSKHIDPSKNNILISDSCNISISAIGLIREHKDSLVHYWVDFDTTYKLDDGVRLKIVNSKGEIERYLDGWLVPEMVNGMAYNSLRFKQGKKGDLIVKSDLSEHRIFHAGDMMGIHHFDIVKPETIKEKASIQLNWGGYDYAYSWLTYNGTREDFHLIKRYAYDGELTDSFYVSIDANDFEIADNHFIQYKYANPENQFYIVNEGTTYFIEPDFSPFGGFGKDKSIDCVHPILHSFKQNGYVENCLRNISFEQSNSAFDWLRNDQNLKVVNATIKSIGYSKFISQDEYVADKYGIRGAYMVNYNFGYSLSDINDSLIFYYRIENAPDYYREFWERRKSENISETVYEILKEVQNHYSGKEVTDAPNLINDTLRTVLDFDLKIQDETDTNINNVILDYYDYLNQVGLSLSAYNLIFMDPVSQNKGLDKEKIYHDLQVNKRKYVIEGKGYFLTRNKPGWIDYE